MKYKITAIIANPKTEAGMCSDLVLKLTARFTYDANQYGNGYYVTIYGDKGFENVIDLRYDKGFNRNRKLAWLVKWAEDYWNGENGAYLLKSITVSRE